jgi:hypothetical protein
VLGAAPIRAVEHSVPWSCSRRVTTVFLAGLRECFEDGADVASELLAADGQGNPRAWSVRGSVVLRR